MKCEIYSRCLNSYICMEYYFYRLFLMSMASTREIPLVSIPRSESKFMSISLHATTSEASSYLSNSLRVVWLGF